MTFAELLRPFRAKDKTDPDLERLLRLAEDGGSNVNLADMEPEEIRRRLLRR